MPLQSHAVCSAEGQEHSKDSCLMSRMQLLMAAETSLAVTPMSVTTTAAHSTAPSTPCRQTFSSAPLGRFRSPTADSRPKTSIAEPHNTSSTAVTSAQEGPHELDRSTGSAVGSPCPPPCSRGLESAFEDNPGGCGCDCALVSWVKPISALTEGLSVSGVMLMLTGWSLAPLSPRPLIHDT